MGTVKCFLHRATDCPSCVKQESTIEFAPATVALTRKQALEIYYSTQAFSENIVFSPNSMMILAKQYITMADLLAKLVEGDYHDKEAMAKDFVLARKLLYGAGFGQST